MDHLLINVREVAAKSNEERIKFIWRDHWIGYLRAIKGISKLEFLYEHPRRQRMPNLLIIGPTNNGKSKLVERFRRNHLPTESTAFEKNLTGPYIHVPVFYMQMPPHPEIKRFYTNILDYFGLEVRGALRTSTIEVAALNQLKEKKVKIIIVDEIHNMLAGRRDQQREFLNVIRFLGNELQISMVAVGTHDAYMAISSDAQLENRFQPFVLSTWKLGNEFSQLLASYESLLPLRQPSKLLDTQTAKYILAKTDGIFGEINTFLAKAAEYAIATSKEYIDLNLLKKVDFSSPSQRRKIMEHELSA